MREISRSSRFCVALSSVLLRLCQSLFIRTHTPCRRSVSAGLTFIDAHVMPASPFPAVHATHAICVHFPAQPVCAFQAVLSVFSLPLHRSFLPFGTGYNGRRFAPAPPAVCLYQACLHNQRLVNFTLRGGCLAPANEGLLYAPVFVMAFNRAFDCFNC